MKGAALHHLTKSSSIETTRRFLKSNYVASFGRLAWQTLEKYKRQEK